MFLLFSAKAGRDRQTDRERQRERERERETLSCGAHDNDDGGDYKIARSFVRFVILGFAGDGGRF